VANSGSSRIVLIDPATNAVIRNILYGGSVPASLTFDGTNIWIAEKVTNRVSAITASSISLYLDKIEVGTGPEGTAFDGVNLWVTNRNSGTVSKVRIEPSFP
ncbi:MAG: hypothetical protein RL531_956, partial [Actinomycetota bacterium]